MATIADLFSQALMHHQAGSYSGAEQIYREVLVAEPTHANAMNCLGAVLAEQGRYAEAEVLFRRLLQVDPNNVDAHNNLATVLHRQLKFDQAVACYRQALRLRPDFAEAHNNLGNALEQQDKLDEAIGCYRQALDLKPTYAECWYNLGIALKRLDKVDEAIGCYRQALALKPAYPKALNNLGAALWNQGSWEEAVQCYQQALQLDPQHVGAVYNMADALQDAGKLDEAIEWYQRAIHLRPDFALAHNNLGDVLLKQGRLAGALARFQEALRCQPDLALAQSNILFCMNYDPEADPDAVFAEHRRWGRLQESAASPRTHANDPDPQRRLRIGYLSPDLRYHPAARYFEPVLAHHDPEQVEVFCYAEVQTPDAVTARLRSLAQGWRWTTQLTDAQLAERIRDDRIDILVDLAGHTNSRLPVLAHKPAPVQATWMGYMNTTGLSTVDYRLTDAILDPPGQRVRDTEELWRLPDGFCCFEPPAGAPAVTPLPALQRGHITFGSLHNLFKLNDRVYDLWSQILKALPSARLLMFRDTLRGTAREEVRRQFSERGLGDGRVELRQGSSASGYLKIYEEIDVSLDAFPCTGGVTTCESLWMGVPVLTLCGVRPAGRNAAALLTHAGLTDWIAQTPVEYVALAARLENELNPLRVLRAGLRERMRATHCDAERFTRQLEEAYRTMWRRWCAKQAPNNDQPTQ